MGDSQRVTELKSALKGILDENDRISASWTVEHGSGAPGGGGVVASPESVRAFRANMAKANEVKGLIDAELGMVELKSFMNAPASDAVGVAAAAAGAGALASGTPGALWTPEMQTKSLGHLFTESPEFKSFIQSGKHMSEDGYMDAGWQIEGMGFGSALQRKDIFTTMPGGPSIPPRFGSIQFDPLIPLQQRRARIRDLFPVQGTSANLIEFFRVTGFQNAASTVPERTGNAFSLKPQSGLTFLAQLAPARIIAHWEIVHRNVLNDEPQIQGLINNELLYGLRLAEDAQILWGTGQNEDLLGIMNTPGIQSYTHNPTAVPPYNIVDNKADDIRRAATRIILAYFEPTGVVLHPFDWEAIELTKDQYGRYLVVTGGVAVGAEKTLWQMPAVDSAAMQEGQFLVGAFGLGAQLYDREVGNIRVAEQHADLFLRNAVAILAEERLALATKRPESFCAGTF